MLYIHNKSNRIKPLSCPEVYISIMPPVYVRRGVRAGEVQYYGRTMHGIEPCIRTRAENRAAAIRWRGTLME